MGKTDIRRDAIMQIIKDKGAIALTDIVQQFAVSEATARRDLEILEQEKRCIRTFGGAVLESLKVEVPFFKKMDLLTEEKKEIAEKAIRFIEDGDIIGLTGGTTTTFIAKKLNQFKNLTVITNAVNIAYELIGTPGLQLIVTGGVIRTQTFELSGPLANKTLENLSIRKTFMGVDGVSLSRGMMIYNELEAETNRCMMRRSVDTYLVADHSKFSRSSLFVIGDVQETSGIISDSNVSEGLIDTYKESGITFF
ncbi:DeoR/GlpR family DNA-binding transcription regulator [Paenibacillus hexagrammi]|uniref:DeoR/GlpR family DNA-binding transcription regulator n=1 Tax=Paenibacillus hexagrammi TaxID=2908839 RepID=A0ABY3SFF6_9BACL|nr:DeoR/GlpR family DNA-binding transcription regulator [Paenibacillus sp. YPD9-1]UJF31911.1 DeoR/GlpR family DNA-binding transcription regulator [Paenibacillus sp. YPD9-1]